MLKRCYICKGWLGKKNSVWEYDSSLHSVEFIIETKKYDCLNGRRRIYYYHNKCIRKISKEPRDFDTTILTRVIEIVELVDIERKVNEYKDREKRKLEDKNREIYETIYGLDENRRSHFLGD